MNEPAMRVFVAGASGAVGRRLCRMLVTDGYRVAGTTRSAEKRGLLSALGIEPVVLDVYDAEALTRAIAAISPEVIIHQLTDLPPALDPARMPEGRVRNARIRDVGTRNLIAAALPAGVKRMIVQSIAFAYAQGPMPYREEDPIDMESIRSFERQVREMPIPGIILRYGKFYGPGTGFDFPPAGGPVHVDAAADAARRAITKGGAGIYNIAEDDGTVSIERAKAELEWTPAFRLPANL